MIRSLLTWTLSLCVIALACSTASAGDKAKKAKKTRPTRGEVVAVDKEVLKVKVAGNKKKGTEASEKSFKLDSQTKVVQLTGKKKDQKTGDAKIGDLQKGQKVTVTEKDGKVTEIKFRAAKKKAEKKKKKAA